MFRCCLSVTEWVNFGKCGGEPLFYLCETNGEFFSRPSSSVVGAENVPRNSETFCSADPTLNTFVFFSFVLLFYCSRGDCITVYVDSFTALSGSNGQQHCHANCLLLKIASRTLIFVRVWKVNHHSSEVHLSNAAISVNVLQFQASNCHLGSNIGCLKLQILSSIHIMVYWEKSCPHTWTYLFVHNLHHLAIFFDCFQVCTSLLTGRQNQVRSDCRSMRWTAFIVKHAISKTRRRISFGLLLKASFPAVVCCSCKKFVSLETWLHVRWNPILFIWFLVFALRHKRHI